MENEELFTAVLNRDLNAVHILLRKGAKPNVICDIEGRTAVGKAAALGENEILRVLMQSCDQRHSVTPMFSGKLSRIVKSIFGKFKIYFHANDQHQYDANTADEMLMTPLHYAAAYGQLECLETLLESGCKVNPENLDGLTPLHLGTKFYDTTLKLLQHGADPTVHSISSCETALHFAVRYRNFDVVQLLLRHNRCQIDAVDSEGRTPFINAIRCGADDIAMLLLENNARIDLEDKCRANAICYAVSRNKLELAKILLLKGACLLLELYLLHDCVIMGFKDMVELLVLHGYSLKMRNPDGLTPIMLAIALQNAEMLEFLLQLSVTLNREANSNEFFYLGSELRMAVECTNHLKYFKPLARVLFAYTTTACAAQANLSFLPTCACSTPLARAIECNKLPIAEYLIKEGIDARLACCEHNLMQLSKLVGKPGVLEFTRFLVYAGFKFKYQTFSHRCFWTPEQAFWTPEQAAYEIEILDLCKNPLPLQALSRLVIRRCLTRKPFGNAKGSHLSKPVSVPESVMQSRIKELGLPIPLQLYIYDFPDCPLRSHASE